MLRITDQLGVPSLPERAALDAREPGPEQRIPQGLEIPDELMSVSTEDAIFTLTIGRCQRELTSVLVSIGHGGRLTRPVLGVLGKVDLAVGHDDAQHPAGTQHAPALPEQGQGVADGEMLDHVAR